MTDIQKMIEEEAERQLSTINAGYWHSGESYTAYERGYEEGFITGANFALSQLQHANRWRKVSEELPEKEPNVTMSQTLCLTRSKRYGIKLLAYNHDYNVWDDEQLDDYFCDKEVIEEWKPIE